MIFEVYLLASQLSEAQCSGCSPKVDSQTRDTSNTISKAKSSRTFAILPADLEAIPA